MTSCSATDHVSHSELAADHGPIVARINIDSHLPAVGIALSRDGERAYVVGSGQVFLVDTIRRKVVRHVRVPHFPWAITVSPDAASVYVAGFSGDVVSVLDPSAERIISNIELGPSRIPLGIPRFATPIEGNRVYLADPASDRIHILDTRTHQIERSIALSVHPRAIAAAADGSQIFIGGCSGLCSSGKLLVLSADGAVHELTDLEQAPQGLLVDATLGRAYVTTGHDLIVVDTRNGQVLASVAGRFGGDIAATADGDWICVHGGPEQSRQQGLALIDKRTLAVAGTVSLHGGFGMVLSPNGQLAYVPSESSIVVIDLTRLVASTGSTDNHDTAEPR